MANLVCNEKKIRFGFFVGDISGVGFGHFGSGYLTLGPTAGGNYLLSFNFLGF